MKYFIGIPCYNCERQISRVIEGLAQLDSKVTASMAFYFVDNGSLDQTVLQIQEAVKRYKLPRSFLVHNSQNYGLGGTQKVCFKLARQSGFESLVIFHGDDQPLASDLPRILDTYEQGAFDSVLGSRFSWNSKRVGYSRIRVLGNVALNFIYSLLFFRCIVDLGSGLNVFRVNQFPEKALANFSGGFTFNMDLLLYIVSNSLNFHFEPITWREFDQVSNARNFRVGWQALKTAVNTRLGRPTQAIDVDLKYSVREIL